MVSLLTPFYLARVHVFSGYDSGTQTSCTHVLFGINVFWTWTLLQCVVGDSSTVVHGSGYLKQWLNWLDAHADVRYAGLEWNVDFGGSFETTSRKNFLLSFRWNPWCRTTVNEFVIHFVTPLQWMTISWSVNMKDKSPPRHEATRI